MARVRPDRLRWRVTIAVAVVVAGVCAACTSGPGDEPSSQEQGATEAKPLPNPPPRYTKVDVDASPLPDAGEGTLEIKCGGYKPYVCMLDDGSFVCSEYPCVPDCTRVGCVGGDVCEACDGGYRCIEPGASC